jgi:uncharacterized membrane protein
MNDGAKILCVAGLGAGLMYLFDPDRGRRRRALLRDKAVHVWHEVGQALDKTARDVANRTRGLIAETESLFHEERVSDEVLVARIRSKLGRVVSHPHAIRVHAQDGRVTLEGPILAHEVERLLDQVSAVRGVKGVENRLEIHEKRDIPALQGGRARSGQRFALLQENWSPTARLVAGLVGGAAAFYGLRRNGASGPAMGLVGLGLLARAVTNKDFARLLGVGSGRRGVDIQKTINVAAPLEKVFQFWEHPENFPHFMKHVREVRKIGDGRYRWTVDGPAGVPVEWETIVTRYEPNKLIAWKSLPGFTIRQAGMVHFSGNADGTTSVDIKLSYNPPAGLIGHAIAEILGVDPKSEMDDDLIRMKTFIETGKPPHDAAQPAERVLEASGGHAA